MSSSYPVQFKGTAFGDPAVYRGPIRPISKTSLSEQQQKLSSSQQATPSRAVDKVTLSEQAQKLVAAQSSTVDAKKGIAEPVDYKGTPLGDPARSAHQSVGPVDYVGAAFGDPAVVAPRDDKGETAQQVGMAKKLAAAYLSTDRAVDLRAAKGTPNAAHYWVA